MTEWRVTDIATSFGTSHEQALHLVAELAQHARATVLERDEHGTPTLVDVTEHRRRPSDDPPDDGTPRWRVIAQRASRGETDPTWRSRWRTSYPAALRQAERWAAGALIEGIDRVVVECSDGTNQPVWP